MILAVGYFSICRLFLLLLLLAFFEMSYIVIDYRTPGCVSIASFVSFESVNKFSLIVQYSLPYFSFLLLRLYQTMDSVMVPLRQSSVIQEQADIRQAEKNSLGPDKRSLDAEAEKIWLNERSVNDDLTTLVLWPGVIWPKSTHLYDPLRNGNCLWECFMLILKSNFPGIHNYTVEVLKDEMCKYLKDNLDTTLVGLSFRTMINSAFGNITDYLETMSSRHHVDGDNIQLQIFSRMFNIVISLFDRDNLGYRWVSHVNQLNASSSTNASARLHLIDKHYRLICPAIEIEKMEKITQLSFKDCGFKFLVASTLESTHDKSITAPSLDILPPTSNPALIHPTCSNKELQQCLKVPKIKITKSKNKSVKNAEAKILHNNKIAASMKITLKTKNWGDKSDLDRLP